MQSSPELSLSSSPDKRIFPPTNAGDEIKIAEEKCEVKNILSLEKLLTKRRGNIKLRA